MDSDTKVVYYERTVPYSVGVRFFINDPQGFVLNGIHNWVAVKEADLRNFKMANKRAITEGLIREIAEPSVDWETPNTYTDEALDDLLKNTFKLKKALKDITSVATVARLLERAKAQNKSAAMVELLEEKLEEIDEEEVDAEDLERVMSKQG